MGVLADFFTAISEYSWWITSEPRIDWWGWSVRKGTVSEADEQWRSLSNAVFHIFLPFRKHSWSKHLPENVLWLSEILHLNLWIVPPPASWQRSLFKILHQNCSLIMLQTLETSYCGTIENVIFCLISNFVACSARCGALRQGRMSHSFCRGQSLDKLCSLRTKWFSNVSTPEVWRTELTLDQNLNLQQFDCKLSTVFFQPYAKFI